MIPIKDIYEGAALDNINTHENGQFTYAMFNRVSKRGELRMMDFLSGDINNEVGPIPYLNQKNRDWLSGLITKYPKQVNNGVIDRPADYYKFENMYLLGDYNAEIDEEDGVVESDGNIPIKLLDGSKFDERCGTYIESLKPSFKKPIAKMVGFEFEFMPKDLGSIVLEYIRYPKYGFIVEKLDTKYNQPVIDEDLSTNYEWPDFAIELLIFFITDTFAIHTREVALKQTNIATKKLERG